jgi:hypothetical protein
VYRVIAADAETEGVDIDALIIRRPVRKPLAVSIRVFVAGIATLEMDIVARGDREFRGNALGVERVLVNRTVADFGVGIIETGCTGTC